MLNYLPTPLPSGAPSGSPTTVSTAPAAVPTPDQAQQAIPPGLQQQQGGGVPGGISNMVKALMLGYKQNPYLNQKSAPTWPPPGATNPVPYGSVNSPAAAAAAASPPADATAAPAGMLQPPPSWLSTLSTNAPLAAGGVDPTQGITSYMSGY